MEINHDVDGIAQREPQLLDRVGKSLGVSGPHQRFGKRHANHFERGVSLLNNLVREIHKRGGIEGVIHRVTLAAAQMCVHPYPIAYVPAQKFVDRHVQRFSPNIPEGVFDAAHCTHAHDAAAEKWHPIHFLVQVLNASGIFSHNQRGKILDGPHHRSGFLLQARFTPSVQTRLIGFHLDENPIAQLCVYYDRLYLRDFHPTPKPVL